MALPGSFRQYFIDAQPSNSTLIQATRTIDRNERAWAANKRLKKVAYVTKVQGKTNPVIFHTLFETNKPCDPPDQWSLSTWKCVLSWMHDNITVNKINPTMSSSGSNIPDATASVISSRYRQRKHSTTWDLWTQTRKKNGTCTECGTRLRSLPSWSKPFWIVKRRLPHT